jgi:hypothetical protein
VIAVGASIVILSALILAFWPRLPSVFVASIKGEKQEEKEEKQKDYYRRERSFGSFERSFQVPEGIDTDKIAASFKNGIFVGDLAQERGSAKAGEKDRSERRLIQRFHTRTGRCAL